MEIYLHHSHPLGARVLSYAVRGILKDVPALATGAVSALGSLGIENMFGKGIPIPKRFITMLPFFKKEFTKAQIDQINRAYQTGGRLVIKPTRKEIEGGFLGTLVSVGITMAISLVSKMFGSGLQVHRETSSIQAMFMCQGHMVIGTIHSNHHPFLELWKTPLGWGKKKEEAESKDEVKAKVYYWERTAPSIQFQFWDRFC